MKHTLTKALAISSISGLSLLAAPQAQAATLDTTPFDTFFGGLTTLTTDNFSITAVSTDVGSLPGWTVALEEFNPFSVNFSFTGSPSVKSDFMVVYTLTSTNPIFAATASLIPAPSDTEATVTKTIFDSLGVTQLAQATVDQIDLISVSTPGFFSPLTSLYIEDAVTFTAGGVIGIGNTYEALPEPLTMLGAASAVGFGGVFKRYSAKNDNSNKA